MSKLPQYRLVKESGIEPVLWAFEDDTLPVRENITIDASAIVSWPIAKGTVMAKNTTTGLFALYLDGDANYGTAYGILDEEVDADTYESTSFNVQAIVGVMGTCYESACTGLDAAAKADLPQIKFE